MSIGTAVTSRSTHRTVSLSGETSPRLYKMLFQSMHANRDLQFNCELVGITFPSVCATAQYQYRSTDAFDERDWAAGEQR